MDSIKNLQTNLAKDLVELEESDIDKETLKQIEQVYQTIYDSIINIDQPQGLK